MKKPRTLADALTPSHVEHVFPTELNAAEYAAFKQAEMEHAPGVAVRMNPQTFRVEYYNTTTGEIVSSHI